MAITRKYAEVEITVNPSIINEIKWLFEDFLGDFANKTFKVKSNHKIEGLSIVRNGTKLISNVGLIFDAVNLQPVDNLRWKKIDVSALSPKVKLDRLISKDLPVLVSGSCEYYENGRKIDDLHDVFGTLFVVLSRYEEFLEYQGDQFGRFASKNCIHEVFIERPFVDEWCLVLLDLLEIPVEADGFRVLPSHDIDFPSIYDHPPLWRRCAGMMKRGRYIKPLFCYLLSLLGIKKIALDFYDCVDWILNESDKRGLKSAFYYIPLLTCENKDGMVDLKSKRVQRQWKLILDKGHELGTHPGFNTYDNAENMSKSIDEFIASLETKDICCGSRQHYLRWSMRQTAGLLDDAGIEYDSTLGFADKAGFRCGTCREYRLFDVLNRKPFNLKERPLVLMDCSLMDEAYMGLGTGTEALKIAIELKNACRKVGGNFTILWHNTRLIREDEKSLYLSILEG